jgi:predicted SnoaL-like aldol condensation-catalyzing enzyme
MTKGAAMSGRVIVVAFVSALMYAGITVVSAQSAPGTTASGLTPNEQLIIDFFGFTGTREARAERFMTVDYVQHNPRFLRIDEFTGAKGNQAWVQAFAEAARRGVQLVVLPGIALRNPIIVLQDGDLAHAVYRGTRPDPSAPGSTYEVFAFESFRIRDGKFSEHWDQVRLAPGWLTPAPPAAPPPGAAPAGRGNAAGRGPDTAPVVPQPAAGCSAPPDRLAANKRLVLSLFDPQSTPQTVRARLASDFVEHSPRGLLNPAAADPSALSPRSVDHIVAKCDYVSVVWKQTMRDPDSSARTWEWFTFDAFRLRGDQILEHWNHEQR